MTSLVVKIHEVFVYRWGEIVQFMDGEFANVQFIHHDCIDGGMYSCGSCPVSVGWSRSSSSYYDFGCFLHAALFFLFAGLHAALLRDTTGVGEARFSEARFSASRGFGYSVATVHTMKKEQISSCSYHDAFMQQPILWFSGCVILTTTGNTAGTSTILHGGLFLWPPWLPASVAPALCGET